MRAFFLWMSRDICSVMLSSHIGLGPVDLHHAREGLDTRPGEASGNVLAVLGVVVLRFLTAAPGWPRNRR